MSLIGFLRAPWRRAACRRLERRLAQEPPRRDLGRATWDQSLHDPTDFYLECVRHFHQKLPPEFRKHRAYFVNVPANPRGFGEDAFHVMWSLLLEQFKPASFLEIGVFRGQVISLVGLWAARAGAACEIWGISPFSAAGDAVSTYRADLDYYQDTLANFDHFRLPHPHLLRAPSTAPEATKLIGSRAWAMIYIDGCHDYKVARQDWERCSRHVKPGGIIVLDDAGLTTSFVPPAIATAGHPGPSRVAQEINPAEFREVLQVGHNRVFQKAG